MPEQERIEAIRRLQEHEAEALKRAGKWDRQRSEDLLRWNTTILPTIYQSVLSVSDDFAVRGSPFLFSCILLQPEGSAAFRVKTTSGVRLFAKLQFDLADAQVTATSTVVDAHFPPSIAVKHVDGEWVELAAERVLIAVINAASNLAPSTTAQSRRAPFDLSEDVVRALR